MKTVKNIMQESDAFKFMMDDLKICSAAGKKLLLNLRLLTLSSSIEKELGAISVMVNLMKRTGDSTVFEQLAIKLTSLKDIKTTLSNLNKEVVPDDIDLFEIKHFALLCEQVSTILNSVNCEIVRLPNLEAVIHILDPEKQRIPHFYIYSGYSKELLAVRDMMKECQSTNTLRHQELRLKEQELEEQVRHRILSELIPHAISLESAFEKLAYLDLLIAKSRQAIEMNLCKPAISNEITELQDLFNPLVKSILETANKAFQPISINFGNSPVLITGANMGGKTVLLKTVQSAQYLFQFGFFIPAKKAAMVPVDEIFMSQEHKNAQMTGLSSFGFEMVNLSKLINAIRSENKVLALIDELARTTNPDEGRAIVNATIDFLAEHKVKSLLTTHYSGIAGHFRRLKVKGLQSAPVDETIRLEEINKFMDYSLEEHDNTDVPAEGIRIARAIGVDAELIDRAESYFSSGNQNKM